MHAYAVGQPYIAGVTSFPEGTHYNYTANGHTLTLFMDSPTQEEIDGVKEGSKEFALFLERGIIFFLCRMDHIPWGDAPYSWHVNRAAMKAEPPVLAPTEGIFLITVLVDAATGLIRAVNGCSLSNEFSQALHQAIRDQMAQPFDQARYERDLAGVYARYPDTQVMVNKAIVRCVGGLPPAEQSDIIH